MKSKNAVAPITEPNTQCEDVDLLGESSKKFFAWDGCGAPTAPGSVICWHVHKSRRHRK